MKKTMVALALVALIGVGIAPHVEAYGPGPGYGPGYGHGGPHSGMMGWGYGGAQQADPALFEEFDQETSALRRELSGLQSQYSALMRGDNPDPERAGELQEKIYDLRQEVHAKAQEFGLPARGPGRGPSARPAYCGRW